MFFKLHKEGKIGYKQLTEADLGRGKGNTTHIGLFGNVLTFLPNETFEDEEALFIYNGQTQVIPYYFKRISRKNGDINSPRIKTGGKNVVSVKTLIQDNSKEEYDKKWYLIWFGLESKKVVFYLFHNKSKEFNELSQYLNLDKPLAKEQINFGDTNYNKLLKFLEISVNENTIEIIKELEVASQVGSVQKKYNSFDLKKANELFKKTGELGEQLVANYLDYLQHTKQIFNFTWCNKNGESGRPYDFTIQDNRQNIIHIDAKSTSYQFEQPMIFSSQEIEFIKDIPNYNIYRVFDIGSEHPKLKICEQSKNLANQIIPHIRDFKSNLLVQDIQLKTAKMAIKPTNNLLKFNANEILLNLE